MAVVHCVIKHALAAGGRAWSNVDNKKALTETAIAEKDGAAAVRDALIKWYGPDRGKAVRHAEAFEICEYGARPDETLSRKLFPFF